MKMKCPSGDEFEARQMCFFFGNAARIVLPIIVKLHASLRAWEKPVRVARARLAEGSAARVSVTHNDMVLPLFQCPTGGIPA